MSEWISIDDELPEAGEAVLVCGAFGKIDIAWYSDVSKMWFSDVNVLDATARTTEGNIIWTT